MGIGGYTSEEDVIQNLKDAGCDPDTVSRFLENLREGDKKDQLKVLSSHRSSLLDQIHRNEKQIVCLDYLIYQIERNRISIQFEFSKGDNI